LRAIENHAEVKLFGDLDTRDDQHLADRMPPDVHSEDLFGGRSGVGWIVGEFDAPALPRPPEWTWALTATVPPNRSAIEAA
jgi:hypothetical protein